MLFGLFICGAWAASLGGVAGCDDKAAGHAPDSGASASDATVAVEVTDTVVSDVADTVAAEVGDMGATDVAATDAAATDGATLGSDARSDRDTQAAETAVDETIAPEVSPPGCDRAGFSAAGQVFYGTEVWPGYLAYNEDASQYLRIEFFPPRDGSSTTPPLRGPGDYPIGGNAANRSYSTCTTCVSAGRDCVGAADCAHWYFAVGGTIHLSEVDFDRTTLAGTLEGATFEEVDGVPEYDAKPLPHGDTWCVDGFAFSTAPECMTDDECSGAHNRSRCSDQRTCVECLEKADCNFDPAKPACWEGACVGCNTSFDCTNAARPVCDAWGTQECVAALDECSGDDALEPNDGPLQATPLALGVAQAAGICSGESKDEADDFLVSTTTAGRLDAIIHWSDKANLDLDVFTVDGTELGRPGGVWSDTSDSWTVASLPAGTYHVVVTAYDTNWVGGGMTAIPYELTVTSTP